MKSFASCLFTFDQVQQLAALPKLMASAPYNNMSKEEVMKLEEPGIWGKYQIKRYYKNPSEIVTAMHTWYEVYNRAQNPEIGVPLFKAGFDKMFNTQIKYAEAGRFSGEIVEVSCHFIL